MLKFKRLSIETTQGHAGMLTKESQFVFNYLSDDPACEISMTMPLRAQSYSANTLPGVLRQNLPEGYLYFWIKEHFGKTTKMDDMSILAIAGREVIGRVHCHHEASQSYQVPEGESLSEILTWQGTEDLFEYLAQKYAMSSGISGVQPKVVIGEKRADDRRKMDVIDKSTIKDRGLIVKSSGDDYPGLAENEFICMSIAKAAGLEVPDFWLSENRKLFVIERFDYQNGRYLGFEDMTSLMNRQTDEKYASSYENVAKAVDLFCSPDSKAASLRALFKSIVLSVLVRNGDAHLKNFGVLYTHPRSNDCRLSPLYDVVNTTAYIPRDTLALKLSGSKGWPNRDTLIEFGIRSCGIDQPGEIIDEIAETAAYFKPQEDSEIWSRMKTEIHAACSLATLSFHRRRRP